MGPQLALCPQRRCSSGVEKLRLTQTHGTLQNRHVKSQARESHWKKNRDVVQREGKQIAIAIHHQEKSERVWFIDRTKSICFAYINAEQTAMKYWMTT